MTSQIVQVKIKTSPCKHTLVSAIKYRKLYATNTHSVHGKSVQGKQRLVRQNCN